MNISAAKAAARAAVAALVIGTSAPAFAQQPPPPPTSLAPIAPPVSLAPRAPAAATRYRDVASERSFVLEERGRKALLQTEEGEIIPLDAVPAQRGDVFLQTPSGDVLIRRTEAGNLVSYMGNKNGAPADVAGPGAPLNAPPMPASLNELRQDAALRLSELAGHEVTIFGTAEFAEHEQWAADALTIVEIGVERANGLAGRIASQLTAVRLIRSNAPSVTFKDGELVLGVNPDQGYRGRVSSDAVSNALTATRNSG